MCDCNLDSVSFTNLVRLAFALSPEVFIAYGSRDYCFAAAAAEFCCPWIARSTYFADYLHWPRCFPVKLRGADRNTTPATEPRCRRIVLTASWTVYARRLLRRRSRYVWPRRWAMRWNCVKGGVPTTAAVFHAFSKSGVAAAAHHNGGRNLLAASSAIETTAARRSQLSARGRVL